MEIIPIFLKEEIKPDDKLDKIIASSYPDMQDGDILVVAQKIISKQENQIIPLSTVIPTILSTGIGSAYSKDPKLVEIILSEAKRVVRMGNRILITETHHGFICANSGVDESNVSNGFVTILPKDPDDSAKKLSKKISEIIGKKIAVIVSDTFGRPFRLGQTNHAIGISNMEAISEYVGKKDHFGKELRVTAISVADELCSAAELVMGKLSRCPAAIIRGFQYKEKEESIKTLLREEYQDMFR
ncbi:MAG: coenzyme F420-0:L-glutamate ligase [Nitrosopumilaceae archaeon]|nr:coenzyme F420-0:L-glutamate ligase [Nitrosopumilaceae archaeon]NIT99744.1 coenzyme F420-0:L-glutamate ligase [Nitrosopumilaceae archaeon]NIU88606.1 coenzyme F420-0:L-glutamate ligase [Nitrosopumilaceae archaeon]NIV64880.1 coenzyme F420-0:L-glutamate ligase [Nitrosopumilaceae archaeon]NIX60347.1 coenzyme F420-0:L-glutamate ligase [Nitrosopumilaceae archaeon]